MIKQSKKIKLPADLYSRNTLFGLLTQFILDHRTPDEHDRSLEVLDVGGSGSRLSWFMPQHTRITILDKKLPEIETKTNYIVGDAANMPFVGGQFDLVICSDMIEHVDAGTRQAVLSELFRVSRRHVILAAPFANIINQKAEEFINNQFREYTGENHPFLIEHLQKGLPDLDEIIHFMDEHSIPNIRIGEGNIYNWYLQQLTSGAKLNQPAVMNHPAHIMSSGSEHRPTAKGLSIDDSSDEKILTFNEFFNENLFKLGNFRAPNYRTVLFCDRQNATDRQEIVELVEEHNNFHTTTYLEAYKKAFDEIRQLLDIKDRELLSHLSRDGETFSKLQLLESRLSARENQLKLLDSQIDEAHAVIQEKDRENSLAKARLNQSENQLNQIQLRAAQIEERLHFQVRQIGLMETQLRSQDILVDRLKEALAASERSEQELTNLIIIKEQSHSEQTQELIQKNQQIINLQVSLAEYKQELETVLRSRSWKLVKLYGKVKNTLYLRPKNLIHTAFQVLSRMGPREFFKRLKRKIFNSRQVLAPAPNEYQKFVEDSALSSAEQKKIRAIISDFTYQPLISILMPVYNVDEIWLRKAINSVMAQLYQKWELCITDDASTAPHIRVILQEYAQMDSRIKVHYRSQNGGIVKASNSALKMAKGAYIGLLDNDDELTNDALYEVVKVLQQQRYDLIYSDEDKLEMDGTHTEPFFKPDFNPDLLFSNNYICHFSVMRRKVVEEIGGLREGLDGSQDYDLVLRLTEQKRSIYHIPKVLYHWRKIPGSTAATVEAKPYVFEAARRALRDTLKRRGIRAEVLDGLWKGSYRVKREIIGEPLVSILIPFRDKVEVLKIAIESIFAKTTYQNYEIILINNDSELLETRQYLREIEHCPRVRLLHYNAPFNYSAINNFASLRAKGEYLILLNNDTEVISADWIEAMLEQAQRPEVGCVGAKLLYPNNQIQHAGVIVALGGAANHAFSKLSAEDNGYFGQINVIRDYSAVTGACLMVRKSIYEDLAGLDEENLAVSFNDVDFCLRLREKGLLVVYTPYALLYHHESYSRGYSVAFNEEYYLRRRHQQIFQTGDPYYNPNLTGERLDFSLKLMDKVK